MIVKAGKTVTRPFCLRSFAGTPVDGDALPTGTLYKNGVATAETVTVVNQTTGVYSAAYTVPASSIGDCFDVLITAVIAGITYKGIPEGMHDVVDTKFVSDLHDIATGGGASAADVWSYTTREITGGALTITPAVPGDKMDLVDAPNPTAITAITAGLAHPGDTMTLSPAYDAAKTASQAGDKMDVVRHHKMHR